MTAINIKAFRPAVPRSSPRLLQGNYATEALNCKLNSGCIDPLKGLTLVHTSLAAAIGTMYRYRNAGVDYWLVWPTQGVTVAPSPNSQDAYNRVYWAGDGEPRMTSYAAGIAGGGPYPAAWFVLGVYIPAAIPTIAPQGGTAPQETRAYVHTFVTQYGEEGAPSLPKLVTGNTNATSWDLSGMEAPPPNSGSVAGAVSLGGGLVRVTLDSNRGLAAHEQITFAGVTGMTDLNGTFKISAVDTANHVDVLLATAQAYTAGGTWARRAPHNTTGMRRRIYRTTGSNTDYRFVAEIPATQTTFNDNVAASALGGVCPSINSYTPPKNASAMVALPNGSLCVIAGNEACFSEIGKPHSWPIGNRYPAAGAVAVTASGNSAVVQTATGAPIIVTATVPEAGSPAKLEDVIAPAIAPLGVVDAGTGALSPSHDGLWLTAPGVARLVTRELFTPDEWARLKPETFKAAFLNGFYYAMHSSQDGTSKVLVLDLNTPDGVIEVDEQVDALYPNPYDGFLYVAKGSRIYRWDSDDANRFLGSWTSPETQLGRPLNFSCAQVHAAFEDIVPVDHTVVDRNLALLANADNIDGALGATPIGVVPLGASALLEQAKQTENRVQFTLLDRGVVKFSRDVTSAKPFRLPAGFKLEVATIRIASSMRVYSVTVAQGMDELKEASV